MISCFPARYDDELLYSLLARYHLRSGNISYKRTLIDLFNTDSLVAIVDLPGKLKKLSNNISCQYSPDQLLNDNTLFPYYRTFLKEDTEKKIKQIMINSNAKNIFMMAGVISSGISFPKYLKYCPSCYLDDQLRYGEPYWHRSHQLPGVFVCHKHMVELQNSNVTYKAEITKQKFFALSSIEQFVRLDENICKNENLVFIAKQSYELLGSHIPNIGCELYRNVYFKFLRDKGLITKSMRIRFQELIPSFSQFYGPKLLEQLECNVSLDSNDTWLHKVLRKSRVACHPLRHILLLGYLRQNLGVYKSETKNAEKSLYPCLNRAADHYGQDVIADYYFTKRNKSGKVSGIFSCSCGFVYSRETFEGYINDRCKRSRIIKFGEVWTEKLTQLHQAGYTYFQMAKKLDVDYNTIVKSIKDLTIKKGIVTTTAYTNDEDKSLRESYRRRWLQNVSDNKGYTRTELRKEKPAVYIWLYRNDKEWLFKNMPIALKRLNSKEQRVDWEDRDNKLSNLIESEVNKIRALQTKPVRISISTIGKRLGVLSLLEKKLEKLPKCKSILENYCESIENFQIRRVHFNASKMRDMKVEVKEWKLIRASGLHLNISEKVFNVINIEVNSS